jgi:hypothetical protein
MTLLVGWVIAHGAGLLVFLNARGLGRLLLMPPRALVIPAQAGIQGLGI